MITELRLKNYRQYKNRTVRLNGTLIGVIGPNGSGKSNLILAAEFLITGRIPDKNKTDLISWGEKSGELGGDINCGGVMYSITRSLGGNKAEVVYTDEAGTKQKVTSIKEVNAFLARVTGIDNVTAGIVFPHQMKLNSILFDAPADRQRAWMALCGLGEAAAIHTKLGQLINSALPETTDYSAQIEETQTYISSVEADLEAALAGVASTKTAAVTAKLQLTRYEDLLQRSATAVQINSALQIRMKRSHDELVWKASQLQQQLQQLLQLLQSKAFDTDGIYDNVGGVVAGAVEVVVAGEAELKQLLDAGAAELERLRNAGVAAAAYLQAEALAQTTAAAVAQLPFTEAQLQEQGRSQHVDTTAMLTAAGVAQGQQAMLEKLLGVAGDAGAGACPLCRQGLPHGQHLQQSLNQELVQVKAKLAQLADDVRLATAHNRDVDNDTRTKINAVVSARSAAGQAQRSRDVAVAALTKLGYTNTVAVTSSAVAEMRKQWQQKTAEQAELSAAKDSASLYLQQLRTLLQAYYGADTAAKEAQARHTAELAEADKLKLETIALCNAIIPETDHPLIGITGDGVTAILPDLQARLQQKLPALKQIVDAAVLAQAKADEMTKTLAAARASVATLNERQQQQQRVRDTKQVLENVRGWFHYEVGPKAITGKLLDVVVSSTNEFLDRFGSRYFVSADHDDMMLRYCYRDGTFTPTPYPPITEMSGGESIVLSVAFRFAVHCLFAGRVNLLTLDEPTAYLDDRHIASFVQLLGTVKTVANGMGLQVIMSTHETAVLPSLDTLVEVAG